MKRIGNLYDEIISIENLTIADKKAQKGKKHQIGVQKHNKNSDQNILDLHECLKNDAYKTSEYFGFVLFEPKRREISRLPYYPDRIVHHAIMYRLEPIFQNCFIAQTYSCIKGRGIHKCLNDVRDALGDRKATEFCLKLDIRKFYPSVDKTILKQKLRRKFKDDRLLKLLDEIIDSNKQGLPLGNYLSQWLANFFLNDFDHWLKEKKGVKNYFRYCDDMVILHHSKAYLHSLRKEIQEYLREIGLELSNYQVFPVKSRGINFVGYVIYHTHTMLRPEIKHNFIKMVKKRKNKKSIASYKGWLLHANCVNLQYKYLGYEFNE